MASRPSCAAAAALLLVAVAAAAPAQLPAEFKICKQADSQYHECLKNAIQGAIPLLVKGIRSLETQPIDPLRILTLSIAEEKDRPVAIKLDFSDLHISGISNSIIESVEMAPGSYDVKIVSHFPMHLFVNGNYKIDGKVLVLPIKGEGQCNLTLSNPKVQLVLKGEPLEKDGSTYFDVKDFKFSFETERLYLDFQNLFNGDKALGDNMNKFLNENWEEILKELKPTIEKAFSLAFKDISNHLFHKVPYNDIFPPK